MAPIHLYVCMLLFITALALARSYHLDSSAAPPPFSKRFADTMDSKLPKFVQSLKLSSQQAQNEVKTLGDDEHVATFLANDAYGAPGLTLAVCQSLNRILGEEQVDSDPVDAALVDVNWSQACWKSPTCVTLPRSSSDVSRILAFIHFFRIKFATRSGGHSPNPGWSSVDEPGILIDLQRIDHITVSDDKKVVSVGPGARWGKVYEVIDPYGVGVIGGRIPNVGVGGLILGGGFFHFSGEYGLAADNVRSFEVVLADGSVVNANARENSDLFWALKGGGPNFGIVTNFELYTVPVHDIWYQVTVHTPDQVPAILEAFTEWQKTRASDLKSTIALIIGLDIITLGLLYSAPNPPSNVFTPLDAIPAATVVVPPTNGTVLSLTQILGSTFPTEPQRHDYRGFSSQIDSQLYKDVYEVWKQQATAVREATGANQTFVLQPIPAALAEASLAKGGNPTGILQENHQWWTTLIDWENADHDDTVRSASIATTDAWKTLSQERDLDVPYIFMNDASRDQDPLASYGEDNVEKLTEIAAQYDPSQVFQRLQNNGFLLSYV